jgi:hypothetical protein
MTADRPKKFRELRKEILTLEQISNRIAYVTQAGDYEAAMVSASLLEFTLKLVIYDKFVTLSSDDQENLFDRPGASLGSLSARIAMAHALGIIQQGVRTQLNRVREIRNHFAHHRDIVSFEHPSVVAECEQLAPYTNFPVKLAGLDIPQLGAKERYIQTCFWTVHELAYYLRWYEFNDYLDPPPINCF